jgi:hypothetical protein
LTPKNPYAGPRWLGFVLSAIGLLTLIAAMANTPLIEWQTGDYVIGLAIAVLVVGFFVAAMRGPINLIGNMKGKTAQLLSVIGIFISGVVIGANTFNENWTVPSILTSGTFLLFVVMFFASFAVAGRKVRDNR